MSEKDVIIKADNLYFSYDDEKTHSLNGLSLEIKRGKKIAFMGANGSGKSTFFLCCNGIHQPSSGTLYFDGQPVDYSRKGLLDLRGKVGIVFQDPDNQLFSASVYQEISFGILNLGVSEEKAKEEVEGVIDEMEITPYRSRPTHALSGGQKKQVSIADILVMHPEVIILDEPSSALDPKHTALVNHAVDRMTEKGITVMMATHDVNYAFDWADETPVEVFSNKRALDETNLTAPAALLLFDSLCQKGILKTTLPVPHNLNALEQYIAEIPFAGTSGQSAVSHVIKNDAPPKKAILVVSFGTSYDSTRKVTIDAIENDIADAYQDCQVYRAWTSKMILAKIQKRDKVHYNTVEEAFHQMKQDGITDVIVQPTHMINGIENEIMTKEALSFSSKFSTIRFGTPVLTSLKDNEHLIKAIVDGFPDLGKDEVLVLMGHGTTHFANSIYAALDYTFKDMGYPNIFLGTVESYPGMDSLRGMIREYHPKRVILAPFMIVAGDHASNDMAGDDPDSWKSRFEADGYPVTCVLKGLGEYKEIRNLLIGHVKEAMREKVH